MTEITQASVEAEEDMYDGAPPSEAFKNAVLNTEDIDKRDKELDMLYLKYGSKFKSRGDCDYFHMLPLSKKQKDHVFGAAIQYQQSE